MISRLHSSSAVSCCRTSRRSSARTRTFIGGLLPTQNISDLPDLISHPQHRATVKVHLSPHHPPSPLQNPKLALTYQFAPFCLSDVSVVTDVLLLCKAEMYLLDCCASPLIIKLGAKPKMTAAI